jgi:hypothetical protein
MATIGLGFQLSASATQMSAGINAGVVELQKLGLAAKKTQQDVSTLKTIELSRAFIATVRSAAGAFQQFIGGTAGAVASIDDLSKRTGISAEIIQGYSLAANQSGVSLETFGKAVQKLTVNLGEAQTGNATAIKSFAELGLSVRDLSQLRPEQAFDAVVAAISQLPNPAQQAAAAVSLFGKSGVELVPIFQEGAGYLQQMTAEARRLGIVLSPQQTAGIATLDDSLQKAQLTLQAFSARVLSELAPSLTKAAEDAASFIAAIDVKAVASAVSAAISDLAAAFQLVATAALPLAGNILPAIGGYLAFINRQVVTAGIASLGRFFAAATASAFGYSAAAGTAATATAALGVSIRSALASTGIGALVVGFGLLAGAALEWALASKQAGAEVTIAVEDPQVAIKKYQEQMRAATASTQEFGQRAKDALKVPDLNVTEFAQNSLSQAESAIKQLAQELGGLGQVPVEVLQQFDRLTELARDANAETIYQKYAIQQVDRAARTFSDTLRQQADARRADADAARAAADAAARTAQEARRRVADLANAGLTDAETSRLQLNRDLLAIGQELRAAEDALAQAKQANDAKSIAAANERLRLAGEATKQARAQDRERQLQALGVDANILKPATSIADQFKSVREAFNKRLIDGGEARNALRNLAAEGISIRKEIAAELARPSANALQVSDIRTQEGASQLLAMATGRQDPALEQRRAQLAKLEEIRKAIAATGASPVEILGA